MATYDYNAILAALDKAYDLLEGERNFLVSVQANKNLIEEYERDLNTLAKANDIVFRYQELEH